MWGTTFTILHILACIFLVVVVLLQTGKGTDVNAVFGGSSQTIFGSSGAGNFLTKLTTATAAVFMATSLYLTYGAARQTGKSVFDVEPAPPAATTPATPEQPPATPGSTSGTTSDKPAEAPTTSQTAPAATPATSSAAPATPTPSPSVTVTTTTTGTSTQGTAPTNTAPTPPAPNNEPPKASEATPTTSPAPK
jgi:preprotein translocase subunit SecG